MVLVALAVTATVLLTVAPFDGDVTETVGGAAAVVAIVASPLVAAVPLASVEETR